jgi:energy-coupling factor transporter ATP-binding protein EcfA2
MNDKTHMPKPQPVPDWGADFSENYHDVFFFTLPGLAIGATALAVFLHWKNWRGSFALIPAAISLLLTFVLPAAVLGVLASLMGGVMREFWRYGEIKKGHGKLRRGKAAIGPVTYLRNWRDRRRLAQGELFRGEAYAAGVSDSGGVVHLPLGLTEGRHSLLIGATGAGKTTTLKTAAAAYLSAGAGLIVIDAKGDANLADTLRPVALADGRPFYRFTLDGGDSDQWNPLAYGTPSERADKLIAAEQFTEPHYKRLYQRYLLMVFQTIEAREETPDLATVVRLLQPARLAVYAREITDAQAIARIDDYLADLTDQEKRDLAGLRNRLAILAESEHGHLLAPTGDPANHIDLMTAIHTGAVVVFSLNTSRYPETAKLLGAAIFQDLQAVAGFLEANRAAQRATGVLVNEFGAFGADHIIGLFQRARSVGLSLVLATQELADLRRIDPAFQDQVIGNVEAVIAHRQNVPESAELVAELAGTREVWIHTFQTDQAVAAAPDVLPTGRGTKRRGHEFYGAPDTIKQLDVGEAVVITKNPHRAQTASMIPTVFPSPTPSADDPAIEAALRIAATMRVRPITRAQWLASNPTANV